MVEKPVFVHISSAAVECNRFDQIDRKLNELMATLIEAREGEYNKVLNFSDAKKDLEKRSNQLKMAAYFQRTIDENRLRLAFQPVVCGATGEVKNYECLLRVVTEEGKIISAGPFIPVAESMGFITKIDIYVLKLAVAELKISDEIMLAVNVSNVSIESGDWIKTAKEILPDPQIANRLIVEITETGVYRDMKKVERFSEEVQSLGCKVAIDDFGTGFTSFSQLKLIHADVVKIDGVFIRDIVDNPDSRLFVKMLLDFATSFGIQTVAEFVETGEIAKVLIEMGIHNMQGNYFSPAVNYRSWIKNDNLKSEQG
jgi:EAL domain-containing protein (putative c-di-GMP-specific phosphodiesterase class I)